MARLVIGAGDDGALHGWRLDGTSGELQVSNTPTPSIVALAVVEREGAPLIGDDGTLRSWRTDGSLSPTSVRGPLLRFVEGATMSADIAENDGALRLAGRSPDLHCFVESGCCCSNS